jgi:Spy/CpxP family protein refolding chaperone
MNMRRQLLTGLALGSLVLGAGNLLRGQEERRFSPDLEQLRETVSERLQAVADKLGLTDEQRTKIREAHTAFAEKYQNCRAERRELMQSELQALGQVLTPEQRETAKSLVEDMKTAAASREWPEIGPIRETLADRLRSAGEKIDLTAEQRTKIREAHASFAEKYRAQRNERHQLVQDELKAVSEVLTPEQREKVRSFIEARMAHAPAAQSVAERIRTVADHLGISSDQRTKIREAHQGFTEQYRALNDQREQLLREELKAVGSILTPEQREKVSNCFADRVVMVGGDLSRLDEGTITQLRETIADRLEGVADKLGLTAEQKDKIKETHAGFIPKYRAQRDQRRELRQKELDALSAILSAEQREKVRDFIGDQFEAPKGN